VEDKKDHVRDKLRTDKRSDHHCHWPGCGRTVPAAAWGCYFHWRKIPERLRKRVWETYRIGQEETKTPSQEYVAVAEEIQRWIRENYEVPDE
jgi:hypothetical protein